MSSKIEEKDAVSRNLRHYRRQKSFTQEQLSESSGVAVRTIQRIENKQVDPHIQTVSLLAKSLDLEINDLMRPSSHEDRTESVGYEKKWLLMLHISPLVGFVIPFANIVTPLFIWIYKRDDHPLFESHGRAIVNFQLSITLVFMLGVVLLLVLFELGILVIISMSLYTVIVTIINAIRVTKKLNYKYFLFVNFL